jgi:hypothetical protein
VRRSPRRPAARTRLAWTADSHGETARFHRWLGSRRKPSRVVRLTPAS